MPAGEPAFSSSVFSVDVSGVGRHPNPVTCVVRGRRGPLSVVGEEQSVTADIVMIRPGRHHIVCGEGGFTVMYLDGARWPGQSPLAERLEGASVNWFWPGCNSMPMHSENSANVSITVRIASPDA